MRSRDRGLRGDAYRHRVHQESLKLRTKDSLEQLATEFLEYKLIRPQKTKMMVQDLAKQMSFHYKLKKGINYAISKKKT